MKKVVFSFIALILIACIVMTTFFVNMFAVSTTKNNKSYGNSELLPVICKQYTPSIEAEINKHSMLSTSEHTAILLAIMAQESGCDAETTPDVFQSSESLGLPRNTLNTQQSIVQGVKYFSENINKLIDYDFSDLKIAVQAYNYGGGFIDFIDEQNSNTYTQELSNTFATKMGGNYGDPEYVAHVYKYLIETEPIATDGEFRVIPIVSTSIRKLQPYGNYHDGGSHYGIDISGGYGAIIVTVADGEVVELHGGSCPDGQGISSTCGGGYGNGVTIKHPNGLYTRYGHMAPNSVSVNVGQQVKAGDRLGLQGDSGSSTATHLHFEVRVANGYVKADTRDPADYISIPYTN